MAEQATAPQLQQSVHCRPLQQLPLQL
eukprot:COSAG03_NODE_13249_length_510_cov_1.019465_2_plen_26_part_01